MPPGAGDVDPMAVLGPHLHDGVSLVRAAAGAGVPLRTAQRWLSRYRGGGPAALTRAVRADAGVRRTPAVLVELIEGMALRRPAPKQSEIHRAVALVAAARGLAVPSYTTVREVVAGIDPGLAELAQHGDAGYRDKFEMVMRRESKHPNDIWQADHTELDVIVLDELGRPARPWLTAILDDHSRACAGYTVFLGDPNTFQTALAFRQAIWRKGDARWQVCGLPGILYSDHGSDFTSAHMEQVCHDTKVQLIHSTPGVPQGRGKVERFFGTITTELLPTLPGHIPHGTHGKPVTRPTLTLAQLDAAVGEFIIANYHLRIHSETGQPPLARWLAGGWLPRLPDSLEQLDLLLLTVAKPRIVHRDGIHLHSTRYLDLNLASYIGEPVEVRYDPRDLGEIRVYHHGQFLCRAVAPELAEATISLKDLQAARNARRRELKDKLRHLRGTAEQAAGPTSDQPSPPDPDLQADPPRTKRTLRLYQTD